MKTQQKKYNIKAKIMSNRKVSEGYFNLTLDASSIAKTAKPGQFVEVLISETGKPFLRRPFSIHRLGNKNFVEILYKVVGLGTKLLSNKKAGERLDIIGPLGQGFEFRNPKSGIRNPIVLVAGGMGIAPLVYLADFISKGIWPVKSCGLVLIGAKTKKEILCLHEFQVFGFNIEVATEDGSLGMKGKTTDLLKNILSGIGYQASSIYTCGPRAMIKEIAKIAIKKKIDFQASLEEIMACGFGACLGCAVKAKKGYKMVCKDGPVFNKEDIDWKAL